MSDASKTMSKDEYLKLPLSGKFVASVKYPFTDYFPTVDRDHAYEGRTAIAVAETRKWFQKRCEDEEDDRAADRAVYRDEYGDDEDSDDSQPVNMGGAPIQDPATAKFKYYSYFIDTLPSCDTLNIGFDISPENRAWCYCPLGKPMEPWRKIFFDEDDLPPCWAKKQSSFKSEGLLQHMNQGKECSYHDITAHYLSCLYNIGSPKKRKHTEGQSHTPTTPASLKRSR